MPRADTEHDTVTATRPPGANCVTSTTADGDVHVSGSVSIAATTCRAAASAAAGERSWAAACAADSAAVRTCARASTCRDRNTTSNARPIATGATRTRPSASAAPRSWRADDDALHGVHPSSGTTAVTETSADVPRMIPGAAPVTVTVTS